MGNVLNTLQDTTWTIPPWFMPYDVGTRKLLTGNDPGARDWEGYRSAVGRFRDAFPGCGLHEVNLLAWLLASGELSLGSTAFQVQHECLR